MTPAPINFLFDEVITGGAVLSAFELCQAIREYRECNIVAHFDNKELEEYFNIKRIGLSARPKGIDITFTPKIKGDFSYIRTDDKRWLKRTDPVIAVSEYIKSKFGGVVIGNGTHERFSDIGLERDIDILIEGNYEPNKNIEATIKEARKLYTLDRRDTRKESESGEFLRDNEEGCGNKTEPKIVWFGRHTTDLGIEHYSNPSLKDIVILYNRSKKFLKMSKCEGWGRPVAEAKRCGCEIINLSGGNKDIEIVSWDSVAKQLLKYLDGRVE